MTENQKLREALLSDMDIAVLRMPVGMAFAGDMAQFQYHNRVQALLNRIKALALPPDVPETNFWKLREALQAIANIDDATSHSADASVALDRIGQIARQALALPTAPVHPDAWGISRALVTLYAYECDGLTGEALALPTADHLPDAGEMAVDHFPDATKMIETAAPVGELPELPEPFALSVSVHEGDTPAKTYVECQLFQKHPNEKQKLYTDDQMRAYARAALSAGDSVLAEREACAKLCEEVAGDLITAMRKEGETDDEGMTSLVASARVCAEEIRGGYSKKFNPHNAAIDAAMRKDKP